MSKPKLTLFVKKAIGGLSFYYSSLVKSGAFDGFDIRYIALDPLSDKGARLIAPLQGAPMETFSYDTDENLYHRAVRLARLLPKERGIVVTNYLTELTCLDICRPKNQTIFHVCHDEVYVDMAIRFAHIIDVFIAHNPYFVDRLKSQLPAEHAKNVVFLPFGIFQNTALQRTANFDRPLKVVFIGRFDRLKGVMDIPLIDDQLHVMGLSVHWLILGSGPEEKNLERAMAKRSIFSIESPADDNAMLRRASEGDVLVLPTRLDGTPLAVMEAMSVGLVPIVSDFNPGARWMVPQEAGYICPIDPKSFAVILAGLNADRAELESRSQSALAYARKQFDMKEKKQSYAQIFAERLGQKNVSSEPTLKLGFLDKPWIPNLVSIRCRKFRRFLNEFATRHGTN